MTFENSGLSLIIVTVTEGDGKKTKKSVPGSKNFVIKLQAGEVFDYTLCKLEKALKFKYVLVFYPSCLTILSIDPPDEQRQS